MIQKKLTCEREIVGYPTVSDYIGFLNRLEREFPDAPRYCMLFTSLGVFQMNKPSIRQKSFSYESIPPVENPDDPYTEIALLHGRGFCKTVESISVLTPADDFMTVLNRIKVKHGDIMFGIPNDGGIFFPLHASAHRMRIKSEEQSFGCLLVRMLDPADVISQKYATQQV